MSWADPCRCVTGEGAVLQREPALTGGWGEFISLGMNSALWKTFFRGGFSQLLVLNLAFSESTYQEICERLIVQCHFSDSLVGIGSMRPQENNFFSNNI